MELHSASGALGQTFLTHRAHSAAVHKGDLAIVCEINVLKAQIGGADQLF